MRSALLALVRPTVLPLSVTSRTRRSAARADGHRAPGASPRTTARGRGAGSGRRSRASRRRARDRLLLRGRACSTGCCSGSGRRPAPVRTARKPTSRAPLAHQERHRRLPYRQQARLRCVTQRNLGRQSRARLRLRGAPRDARPPAFAGDRVRARVWRERGQRAPARETRSLGEQSSTCRASTLFVGKGDAAGSGERCCEPRKDAVPPPVTSS